VILAVDVGTSILKGALFTLEGAMVRRAERALPPAAAPADPLRSEVDAREWLLGLRDVADRLGLGGARVPLEAAVVSGNGPTLVAVGSDGAPLLPAMTWMDRRAGAEAAFVTERAGWPVDASFALPKALWIKRNAPAVYEGTRHFLPCPEYVVFAMTGTAVTFLPGPRFERYVGEERTIHAIGLDGSKFPRPAALGSLVGRTTAAGTAATGVPAGVPVYAAGPDFIVSLLGTATVLPGRACLRSGTSEGINLCATAPVDDRRLLSLGHPAAGLWNVSGIISTSGRALAWFRDVAGSAGDSYEHSFAEIDAVPAGANRLLFLPYLAGERAPHWDPAARGAFLGLTLAHGRQDMMRAVIESVAFATRDVIEVMEGIGLAVADFRVTGKPARSRLWNQVKSDVTGRRLLVPSGEDPDLTGDACLALGGLGEFYSAAEAAEAIVRVEAVYEPRPGNKPLYDELFLLYRDSYRQLKDIFARLGRHA
jgi:xylulokinase